MSHRSELELEMKMMRAPAIRAEITDDELPKRFAAQIADLARKLREIDE